MSKYSYDVNPSNNCTSFIVVLYFDSAENKSRVLTTCLTRKDGVLEIEKDVRYMYDLTKGQWDSVSKRLIRSDGTFVQYSMERLCIGITPQPVNIT